MARPCGGYTRFRGSRQGEALVIANGGVAEWYSKRLLLIYHKFQISKALQNDHPGVQCMAYSLRKRHIWRVRTYTSILRTSCPSMSAHRSPIARSTPLVRDSPRPRPTRGSQRARASCHSIAQYFARASCASSQITWRISTVIGGSRILAVSSD